MGACSQLSSRITNDYNSPWYERKSIRKDISAKVRIDSFRAHHWNEVELLSVPLQLGDGAVIASAFIEV